MHPEAKHLGWRLMMVGLWALVAAGCGRAPAPGQGASLGGTWRFVETVGYYTDLSSIPTGHRSSINPSRLTVYPDRWVLSRTKRPLRRVLVARARGTGGQGSVRLTDPRTGRVYSGRYEVRGQSLYIYFVPGKEPPTSLVRRPRQKGTLYARLKYVGPSTRRARPRCQPRRAKRIAFDTPRATFETLLLAVGRSDVALFRRCFLHPPDEQAARRLLVSARRNLRRSCFLRARPGKRWHYFWYLLTNPQNAAQTREDRGRMRKVGKTWRIYKL